MPNGLCERVIPTVATTPKGRIVAAYTRPCRVYAIATVLITPPHPDEKSFEVDLCPFHNDEALTHEPLDEDRYTYCNECRSYADIDGNCGCP